MDYIIPAGIFLALMILLIVCFFRLWSDLVYKFVTAVHKILTAIRAWISRLKASKTNS